MQHVNIPEERVAVLIGAKGKTKREIEKRTKTEISVEETSVSIDGDSMGEWTARDIVKAIGRGFSPERACLLLDEDSVLEIIPLTDLTSTEKEMIRQKGRIIGRNGTNRKFIEKMTGAYVSVYGKTVAIIGPYECISMAKEAIMMLLSGKPHSTVRRHLERSRISAR